ncbi:hypothetical protein BCR34DRAFT_648073, partial [Clohesyomyces aquaticus]
LPLRADSRDGKLLYVYEAQISSLSLGPDEWFWTEFFLVDTYFGSEHKLHEYLSNCKPGEGFDPPLGGVGMMDNPYFDPREYFLVKLVRRLQQVVRESTSLVDTFDERMEDYLHKYPELLKDDEDKTHTRTMSNVIAKIQQYSSCLKATSDEWTTFYKTQIAFFTATYGKQEWQPRIDKIVQDVGELDRLRAKLLERQELFESKLANLASASHRPTAAYTAFPLLFTAAIFSMGFVKPKHPWVAFFLVLLATSICNYMVATRRSPFRICLRREFRRRSYISLV